MRSGFVFTALLFVACTTKSFNDDGGTDGAVDVAVEQLPVGTLCSPTQTCPSGLECVYSIASGCGSVTTCQARDPQCGGFVQTYCGCDGGVVGVTCADPPGYSFVPVTPSLCDGGFTDGAIEAD